MVSVLSDEKYTFPKPIELDKTLGDILEKEVDDKYYLNNDKAKKLIKKLLERYEIKNRESCDLTLSNPKIKNISNCITARYDSGIQNIRSANMGSKTV